MSMLSRSLKIVLKLQSRAPLRLYKSQRFRDRKVLIRGDRGPRGVQRLLRLAREFQSQGTDPKRRHDGNWGPHSEPAARGPLEPPI